VDEVGRIADAAHVDLIDLFVDHRARPVRAPWNV
jgi:hypothetical protein